MSVLHEGLAALGFEAGAFSGIQTLPLTHIEQKLEAYCAALLEYNAKFDLINTDDHDEVVVRHLFDSLAAVPALCARLAGQFAPSGVLAGASVPLPCGFTIADIGSGAGLPGIPLATVLPGIQFVLVERMTKRCAFLEHCVSELGLTNVTVQEKQAERLAQKQFDAAVFRAFRPLEKKMTKVLLRILKDGGFLAAYKARREKIEAEMAALPQCPPYSVVPLAVPFLTQNSGEEEQRERNLVFIEKTMQPAQ